MDDKMMWPDSFLYGLRVIVQKDDVAHCFTPWWGDEKLKSWTRRYDATVGEPSSAVEFFTVPLTEIMGMLGWHPDSETASLVHAQDKPALTWVEFAEHLLRQGMIIETPVESHPSRELEKHLQLEWDRVGRSVSDPFHKIQAVIPGLRNATQHNVGGEYQFFFSSECHPEGRPRSYRTLAESLGELLKNNPTKLYETCFEYRADDQRGPKIGIYRCPVGDKPYIARVDEGFASYLYKNPHETYQQAENDLINIAKKRWIKFRNGRKTKDGLIRNPLSRLEVGNADLLPIVERAQKLSITTRVLDTTTVPQKTEWIVNGDNKALKDCVVHYKYEEAKDNVIRYALGLPLKTPSPPPKYIDYSKKHGPDSTGRLPKQVHDEQQWARIILNYPLTNGESVHQRYRSLMLVYHPDKHPAHESAYWNQKVRELKDAYNIVAA